MACVPQPSGPPKLLQTSSSSSFISASQSQRCFGKCLCCSSRAWSSSSLSQRWVGIYHGCRSAGSSSSSAAAMASLQWQARNPPLKFNLGLISGDQDCRKVFKPLPVTCPCFGRRKWIGGSSHSVKPKVVSNFGQILDSVKASELGSNFELATEEDGSSNRGNGREIPCVSNCESLRGRVVVVGKMLVLCCVTACLAWLLSAGKVYAAAAANDMGVLTTLSGRASDVKGALWPKVLQVLAVFKDQGLLLTALLSLSAFFSMAETSIMTLWPWKVRELAEKEGEGGVFRLLRQDVTRFLTTILIGTTVVNIAATALVTDASTTLFGEAGITAATGVMTVVILLLTEIAPKSIAVHNATDVARVTVRPVAWLSVILYPVGRIVTALSSALLKLLGLKSSGEPFVSEEELKLMLRGAELSGAIEEEEQDMIENVLEIKDTFVREVMTPLVDVVAIDAASTLMEFRDYWVKHQYSRTPVFERRVDNIVGIAYAMDMLDYVDYEDQQSEVFKRLTVGRMAHRPAYFVPDSMSVWNLLREFRIRKVHMAIVLNEYGGTVGVVTLEDVVEEIVGEIFDENDSKEEIRKKTGYVVQRADGVFDVDANTHIEDLSEALEVKMPEGPYRYETVSGFVCEAFGYIPRTGESINVVLKKAEGEDHSQDRRDGDEHHQVDHRKEKFHKFRVEILAGNARKVGAVRFELTRTQTKEEEGVFPQNVRVFAKGWTEPVDNSDESNESTSEDFQDDEEYCEPESIQGPECEVEYLDEEPVNTSIVAESVPVEVEATGAPVSGTGYTVIGLDDWETLDRDAPKKLNDIVKNSNGNVRFRGGRSQKWVKQVRNVERRIQERRRQSVDADAAIEVERRRRIELRRREDDLAMAAMKQDSQGRDDKDDFGSSQKRSN